MGKRGPPPQPTQLKVLRGNPGRRPLNKREPQPPSARPSCPRWLTAEARKEWRRIVPVLEEMGLLFEADRASLAGYCAAYARWKEAEEAIACYGLVVKAPSGYVMPVPHIAIANKSLVLMRQFAADFGLNPSSRSGIVVADAEKDRDPFERFLSKKRTS